MTDGERRDAAARLAKPGRAVRLEVEADASGARPAGAPPGSAPTEAPTDVEVVRDVEFGTGGGPPFRLHLLRPHRLPGAPMPVVVWVHGGAWRTGSRDSGIPLLVGFARRGYLCTSVEYRLTGEATFPAQIQDCKCAIRFLRAHADTLGIDPDRIGVRGSSAGGHLVALLGTTGQVRDFEGEGGWSERSSEVQAVCDWYGPTDFLQMDRAGSDMVHDAPDSPESQLVGGPIQEHRALVARANPITYVTGAEPPFLVLHGDRDPLVPLNQSELLYAALERAGAQVTFGVLKGAGHGGPAFAARKVVAMVEAFFDASLTPS